MVMAPISSRIIAEAAVRRDVTSFDCVFVTPKIERAPAADGSDDITLPIAANTLTELTGRSDTELDGLVGNGFARKVFDLIEARTSVRVFALPFEVDTTDTAVERMAKVVTAIGTLNSDAELMKLPHARVPSILLPRETGVVVAANADGVDENAAVAALETQYDINTHIGAVSFCDAGPITVAARADAVADQATLDQAAVTAWQGLNSHPGILAVVNRADAGGYSNMWGSVLAYVHWANSTSVHGLHHQPTTFDDPVAGVSGINPLVTFNPRSTGGAVALRHENLSSIITWEGQNFLYGGRTAHDANDPRRVFAYDIIANDMVASAQRDLLLYLETDNTPTNRESLKLHVQNDLNANYLNRPVTSITVLDPVRTGDHLEIEFLANFPGLIGSVRLTARITEREPTEGA